MIDLRRPKLVLILLVFAAAAGMVAFGLHAVSSFRSEAVSSESQPVENTALVWLFTDEIQKQSDLFYGPYYTSDPMVDSYWTTVRKIEKKDAQIYLTFSTLPYLGPHDTIGEDEITFRISRSGETEMAGFRHLKSYPLPDHLKNLEKGALPPTTE